MPHPEHAVDPLTGSTDGLRVFDRLSQGALVNQESTKAPRT